MNWTPPKGLTFQKTPVNKYFGHQECLVQQVNHDYLLIGNYSYLDFETMNPDKHNTVAIFHVKLKSNA